MSLRDLDDVERPSPNAEAQPASAVPGIFLSARTSPEKATLARSLAAGASLSNRAVAHMLMRDIGGYWATVADDPSYAVDAPASSAARRRSARAPAASRRS